MDRNHQREVIAFLVGLPVPADVKTEVFFAWARAVGVKLSSSQRARVIASGIDNLTPI